MLDSVQCEFIGKTIKTKRLLLRPIELGDGDAIHEYAGDPSIDMMIYLPKETREDTENFVKFAVEEWAKDEPEDREYVVVLDGKIIGGVNLELCGAENTHEIGWLLNKSYRGFGYATEAALALERFAFLELGSDALHAHCDSRNKASEKVMKKLGMTLIDGTGTRTYEKTGVTSGEYLFQITKEEYEQIKDQIGER